MAGVADSDIYCSRNREVKSQFSGLYYICSISLVFVAVHFCWDGGNALLASCLLDVEVCLMYIMYINLLLCLWF